MIGYCIQDDLPFYNLAKNSLLLSSFFLSCFSAAVYTRVNSLTALLTLLDLFLLRFLFSRLVEVLSCPPLVLFLLLLDAAKRGSFDRYIFDSGGDVHSGRGCGLDGVCYNTCCEEAPNFAVNWGVFLHLLI